MMLVEYLLINILKTITLSFLIIFSATWFDSLFASRMLANSLSKILVILGSLVIVNWTTNALDIYAKVKNYNDYQKEVSDIVQE
ncbi:MAG: hypothetical protein F6K54_39975 [Okeania sp. SIO3B5]|uniref:hypothetical protein n=1 Tax=Okeania sp. SIO3B5 TaxID=2607811 RepID=UPI0013FF128E|nr:hypothetical protein [Okeania sp. SIO3B5]NEO58684.1 hypothetical protein [Okeania sp. SIO3B5]